MSIASASALLVVSALTAAVVGSTIVVLPAATADSRRCITKPELDKLERGMTPSRVRGIVDSNDSLINEGRDPSTGLLYMTRFYGACAGRPTHAWIAFTRENRPSPYHLSRKIWNE
jgi:hypothetical protein